MKHPTPAAPPLPALSLVGSTRFTYLFSRILVASIILFALCLLFVPWRQNVVGNGRVVAFDPLDRVIEVESQLAGRIRQLHVVEGQSVKEGDILVEIEDNDPQLMENLRLQKNSADKRKAFAEGQLNELLIQHTQLSISMTNAVKAAKEAVNAASIKQKTAELEKTRRTELFNQGLASRREFEVAKMNHLTSTADLKSTQASLTKTTSDYQTSLSANKAQQEATQATIEAAKQEIVTLDIKINQTKRQTIYAPRAGIVYKVKVTDGSYLKPGGAICTIIPETDSRYVEVWLDGNDIALIRARHEVNGKTVPGSHVRLSFEGWPSIQAIGWPQLAVGTFGGEVIFIDSASNGKGSFRVVVGPTVDQVNRYNGDGLVNSPWPDKDRWLRQGTLTQAWFLLDEVPLWLEMWRQINGFPPLIIDEDDTFTN